MISEMKLKAILTTSVKRLIENEDVELMTTKKHVVDYLYKRLVEEGAVNVVPADSISCCPASTAAILQKDYYEME